MEIVVKNLKFLLDANDFEMHLRNEFLSNQSEPDDGNYRRKYYVRSSLTNRALLRDQLQLKQEHKPMEELIKSAIGPNCLSFTIEEAAILIKHGVGK